MRIDPLVGVMAGAASAVRPTTPAPGGPGFGVALRDAMQAHVVRPGDTLSEVVAQRLGHLGQDTSGSAIYHAVSKVAQANDISNANFIRVGQRIDLSILGGNAAAAIASNSPESFTPVALAANRPAPSYTANVPVPPPLSAPVAAHPTLAAVVAPIATAAVQAAVPAVPPPARSVAAVPAPLERPAALERATAPTVTFTPAAKVGPAVQTAVARSESAAESSGPWASVLGGPARLTSEFGLRHDPFNGRVRDHQGIDLAASRGTPVFPVASGRVTFSGWSRTYGNHVVVSHGDGVETLYGHQQRNHVSEGDRVNASTSLGAVGSTGRATAPHLHLEVHRGGEAIDPIPFITGRVPLPGVQSAGP